MEIRRVAVIYDDRQRPETTGVYCRRALESLVEVVHFRPDELVTIPHEGFDLYFNVDDSLEYHLPDELRPSAWWAIDTHLNFDWCRRKAALFDFVFAAQRDGALGLEAEGIAPAAWLPLACDPDVHRRINVERIYDVAFVGNLFPGPRAELLELLQRRFPSMFVGRAYFDEMARAYSATRLAFNRSVKNDVNMRVFEAVACGSLLLTNDLADNGQADLFRDGVHLATYRDADDLIDKAAYYLKHDSVREWVARAGRAEALAKHTYRHRMQFVLERVARGTPRAQQRRPAPANGAAPEVRGYHDCARPELVALVPGSATRVLDIGCGAGRLGEALKARQPVHVAGIELVPEAADRARDRLDDVFVGDVEQVELPFAECAFDCVVCGDVLEHLRDPKGFLDRARSWLAPDGCVVASLPNVRHHSVVSALLDGNWSYEPAGLLDETHLRFFTRRDMLDLFDCAGFEVLKLHVVPGPGYEDWRQSGCPGAVRAGRLQIAGIPPEEAEEFFVYQYLIVARPKDAAMARALAGNGRRREEKRGQSAILRDPVRVDEGDRGGTALQIAAGDRDRAGRAKQGLRIAFLGNFEQAWSTEQYAADALERVGHTIDRVHEYGVRTPAEVLSRMEQFQADCLLFFKGRIGVDPRDAPAVLRPDPSGLIELLRRSPVPAYLWYYDRAHDYPAEPSRIEWMRRVAPLCRVAFVTDAGLTTTDWANWRVLRQGISRPTVTSAYFAEQDQEDVAFVGQLYGPRQDELAELRRHYRVDVVSNVFGRELSTLIRRYRIVIGPHYPNTPGYWSDRLYVVLGHGGFFLAPEVGGMRDEGFEPGVHYAPLGDDAGKDVRRWLDRPDERAQIARRGQKYVLGNFTYEDRASELAATIVETLKAQKTVGAER